MNAVLDGLASNPALPSSLLDRLIAFPALAEELAQRLDLAPHHVRALLAVGDAAVTYTLLDKGWVAPADVPLSNPQVALAVAGHPDADPAVARSLAASGDVAVRLALPERARRLPADVIELLAGDQDDRVVAELVTFHALPSSLAEALSRHPGVEVRRALAASSYTPAAVLVRLGYFPRELAQNPATPPLLAAELLPHHVARYWLASRVDLPPEVYAELASELEPGILAQLAGNPAVPVEVLRSLVTTRAAQRELLRNPAVPLDLLVEVAAAAQIGTAVVPRVAVASEDELRALVASDVVQARMLVGARADLPLELVQQLVSDPDPGVAAAVVTNPLVTVEQLWWLVERHGAVVYPRVARSPLCPSELLHHMASRADGVGEVHRAVARHPRARGETLLLCLEDAQARHLAACHPALPVPTIMELLGGEFTAGPAAANPSLPVAVMEELLS